jgi:hypothetical protein
MSMSRLAALFAASLCLLAAAPKAAPSPIAPEGQHRHRHTLNVQIDETDGETVAISEDAHVTANQVHEGEIVAIFGNVRMEGRVTGDVVVILGSLDLSGTVEGQVVSILSRTKIADTARIDGDLVTVGWSIDGDIARSQVGGELVNVNFLSAIPFAGKGGGWSGLMRVLFIIRLMTLAALFLIVLAITALVPRRLGTIAAAFPRRWGASFFAGLLTYAAVAIGAFLLAVTIIGIPLAVALGGAMLVVKWLGVASMLLLIGQTAGKNLFQRDLPHITAVLGGFFVYALFCLIPLFGWFFEMTFDILAVGIAVLTKFGSDEPWRRAPATTGPYSPSDPGSPIGPIPPVPAPSDAVPPRL